MTIREMREERMRLYEQAKAVLATSKKEKRLFSSEEDEKVKKIYAEMDTLKAQTEAEERLIEEKRALDRPDTARVGPMGMGSGDFESPSSGERWMDSSGREVRLLGPKDHFRGVVRGQFDGNLSLGKTLRGIITGNWANAESEQRALTSGGTAGILLDPSLSDQVIDFARAQSKVLSAGAQVVQVEKAELTLARVENDPTASWRPENVTVTASDVNFAAIVLKPKTLSALIKIPVELAQDAANLESLISNLLTKALGAEFDRALLYGDGATEPKGLRNYIGDADQPIGTQDPAGPLTDYDDFSLASQAIKQANFQANAVILSPRSWGQLDRAVTGITGDKTPLTPPQSWAELQRFVTSQVPDTFSGTESDAFVGQWDQLLVGIRQQVVVETTRKAGTSFQDLQVWVRAFMRVDAALARAGAFEIVTGIEA